MLKVYGWGEPLKKAVHLAPSPGYLSQYHLFITLINNSMLDQKSPLQAGSCQFSPPCLYFPTIRCVHGALTSCQFGGVYGGLQKRINKWPPLCMSRSTFHRGVLKPSQIFVKHPRCLSKHCNCKNNCYCPAFVSWQHLNSSKTLSYVKLSGTNGLIYLQLSAFFKKIK